MEDNRGTPALFQPQVTAAVAGLLMQGGPPTPWMNLEGLYQRVDVKAAIKARYSPATVDTEEEGGLVTEGEKWGVKVRFHPGRNHLNYLRHI